MKHKPTIFEGDVSRLNKNDPLACRRYKLMLSICRLVIQDKPLNGTQCFNLDFAKSRFKKLDK